MIYHLVSQAEFQRQPVDEPYVTASLASAGFIHLTAQPSRVAWVANAFYRDVPDLLVLAVDEGRLAAPLRHDQTPDGIFPHLYGPLNRDAISKVIPMRRDVAGNYVFSPPSAHEV